MGELRFLSKIEQVAAHLRAELAGGRWEEAIPGRMELSAELGINAKTVEEALRRLLAREGIYHENPANGVAAKNPSFSNLIRNPPS